MKQITVCLLITGMQETALSSPHSHGRNDMTRQTFKLKHETNSCTTEVFV